jgi:8-oxo-dGTP pyrophosphatase MutT (NUDIX family)
MSTYYEGKIVVAIIKNNKGKILLARVKDNRLEAFGNLRYVFPGGTIIDDESPIETLEREAFNETGYKVDVVGQVSYRVHPVTGKEIYYYYCKYDDSIPQTEINCIDVDSVIWVDRSNLLEYMVDLNPDVSRAISLL